MEKSVPAAFEAGDFEQKFFNFLMKFHDIVFAEIWDVFSPAGEELIRYKGKNVVNL